MLSRTLLVLALVAAAQAAAAVADETNHRENKGIQKFGSLFPSLISVITFDNEPCETASGGSGVCYSQKECANMEGEADGTCANGFGVCCVLASSTGDVTISESGQYFENLGYPNAYALPGIRTATLDPPEGTTQVRLDFEDLNLAGPIEGECSNDTLVVIGANPGTEIPVICGYNNGQHMYFNIDNSEGPYKLLVTTSSAAVDRTWKVKTTFYSHGDEGMAPQRCLQYFTEKEGDIMSFNYKEDYLYPMMLNNQDYAICFGYVAGYCDIGATFSRFDLGNLGDGCGGDRPCGADKLYVGGESFCGDCLDYSIRANATGPIVFNVVTDDNNEREEEGFLGTYMMMAC